MPTRRQPGVVAETARSVKAATHLTDMDAGAVAVLLQMAKSVDYLLEHDGLTPDGKLDNVSIPTYLRYCESLGLTPAGRVKLSEKKEAAGGKLAQLRSIQGGKKRPS